MKVPASLLLTIAMLAGVLQPAASAAASSTVYLACTPTIRMLTEPVRNGARPSGATVLGLSDPNQTLSLGAGAALTGDVYLFNNASLSIAGGPARIAGNVYLVDHSSVHVINADLTVPSTDTVQYKWVALDDATVEMTNSRVTVAATVGGIHRQVLCGRAHAIVQGTDFSSVKSSTEALFVWESASLSLGASQGSFEVSADEAGHVDITDQHTAAPGHTLVYFAVHSSLATPLILAGGAGLTADVQIPSDLPGQAMVASIRNSDVIYALRVDPGANLVLNNSNVGLFVTAGGSATLSGLGPGHFASQTVNMGDRTIGLINTDVWVWNVYEDGPSGTFNMSNAWLGELGCTSTGTARCDGQNIVIDGSGGYLSAVGTAQISLDHSLVMTYLTATDSSTMRLRSSFLIPPDPSTGRLVPWISVTGNGLVVLENSTVDPQVGTTLSNDGAVASASIDDPQDGVAFKIGTNVVLRGTAAVRSANPTGRNAFVSFALTAAPVSGSKTVPIVQSRAPITAGVLGTWPTAGLAAGTYTLHLVLTGRSGQLADVTRRVIIAP